MIDPATQKQRHDDELADALVRLLVGIRRAQLSAPVHVRPSRHSARTCKPHRVAASHRTRDAAA